MCQEPESIECQCLTLPLKQILHPPCTMIQSAYISNRLWNPLPPAHLQRRFNKLETGNVSLLTQADSVRQLSSKFKLEILTLPGQIFQFSKGMEPGRKLARLSTCSASGPATRALFNGDNSIHPKAVVWLAQSSLHVLLNSHRAVKSLTTASEAQIRVNSTGKVQDLHHCHSRATRSSSLLRVDPSFYLGPLAQE